ncbi:MAG: hypothetical protein PHV30_05100, partial [Candidatus Margulisbacteria bacterium]|nr:hypothetical protein [Candidatus Margulisiibacteriota bacterium]
PPFLINYLQKMDRTNNYSNYEPSSSDSRMIADYIERLPELNKKVLTDHVLGIYFINNYRGSGLTDYILENHKVRYFILVFNPGTLTTDASAWLTYKENTCFKPDKNIHIEIDCGKTYTGFMYILLHETSHMADYLYHFSPYVEPDLRLLEKTGKNPQTAFTKDIWQNYTRPVSNYQLPWQNRIHFYDSGKKPKLSSKQALAIYKKLQQTPFASLYGSQNWAEDFAEFITWHHWTQKLGQPYTIKYFQKNLPVFAYAPLSSPLIIQRYNNFPATI